MFNTGGGVSSQRGANPRKRCQDLGGVGLIATSPLGNWLPPRVDGIALVGSSQRLPGSWPLAPEGGAGGGGGGVNPATSPGAFSNSPHRPS